MSEDRIEAGSHVPQLGDEPASAVNPTTADTPTATVLRELTTTPGPSVLLIHGLASSSAANWVATRWVRSLGTAGFHVWAVDLPAHGMVRPVPSITRETLCAEIIGHARRISSDPVVAVGYSLGAQLLYQCAASAPSRFSRLVLGGFSMVDRLTAVLETPDFLVDPAQRHLARCLVSDPFHAYAAVPHQPALLFSGADDAWSTPGDHAVFLAARRRRRTWESEPPTEVHVEPKRDHVNVVTSKRVRDTAVRFLPGRTPGASHGA